MSVTSQEGTPFYSEDFISFTLLAPPVAEWYCLKLEYGRCQVQIPITLVDLTVRNFPWFSPNSKYGLGSLRKTPTEDIPPTVPDPTSGQLALKPTTQHKTCCMN